jgi:hypothetical protein
MSTMHQCKCGAKVNIRGFILQALVRCPACGLTEVVAFPQHIPFTPVPQHERRQRETLPAVETPLAPPRPVLPAFSLPELKPEVVSPPESPPEPEPATFLTAAHRCDQCSGSLLLPIGKAADTVTCPRCQHKTSVYAILHRCAGCSRLLESPASTSGSQVTCPRCWQGSRVPWPVLHHRPVDEAVNRWFWCTCANCQERAAVRTDDVGVLGACPSCLWPMEVPRWGERPDAEVATTTARNVRCPGCHMQVPLAAAGCPLCGASLPGAG